MDFSLRKEFAPGEFPFGMEKTISIACDLPWQVNVYNFQYARA